MDTSNSQFKVNGKNIYKKKELGKFIYNLNKKVQSKCEWYTHILRSLNGQKNLRN